jgi:hypothetical protein
VAVIGILATAALAAAPTTEVTDPAGDLKNNVEPWQDIVSGAVVRQGNTLTFSMKLAGALPADPRAASGGLGSYLWIWGVDTDPDVSPAGWPFPSGQTSPADFFVILQSDGEQYFAYVGDRRDLDGDGEPILTPVPFRIRGSSIQVSVDADLLDNPAEFLVWFGSVTSHAHFGSEGFDVVDADDAGWVAGPQE